jgi:hypothetical protein
MERPPWKERCKVFSGRLLRDGEQGPNPNQGAQALLGLRAAPSAFVGKGVKFDPIGGMQNHTAELTRALDRRGVVQTVVTTRPPTAPHLQLSLEELRVVRDYEERTKRRDTLLERLDSKIRGGL